jgi:hypothetical protein
VKNNLFALNRLILIDSYKPGTLQEIRLDGHTNLNGVNGAGKTTLLRLIPLFFGERPGRLVPKSRVTDSFAKHYLPNESSYIIFEYLRGEQTCLAVIYASPNEEGLCYRFVDKGFDADDFLETRSDGTVYPISCRDLGRHLAKRRIQCSKQITSCLDYRTVIQNLPHKKGQELRQLVARYSFCQGAAGRRLKDIEKIVSGMLMRSTNFSDLREMLVNCIDENRDAIALEVQMETLESWHKEYQAFQKIEAERDKASELSRLENDLLQIETGLGELQQRLRLLLERNQQEQSRQAHIASETEQKLELLINEWHQQEQALKSELATVTAALQEAERQKTNLEQERDDWEKLDIQGQQQRYGRLHQIKANLTQEQENLAKLKADVQDIEAEFGRLKAEKENQFNEQQHYFELAIGKLEQQANERKAEASAQVEKQKEALREQQQQEQDRINQIIGDLRQEVGELNGKIKEIQPDPSLLESREAKFTEQQDLQRQKHDAEQALKTIESEINQHHQAIEQVFKEKRHHAEEKQRINEAMAHIQRQLDADADTLLGFLREHHPDWINNTAKVIRPELLLRDDLEPERTEQSDTLYGLRLNLDVLPADQAADELQLRASLQKYGHQLAELQLREQQCDEDLAHKNKITDSLNKKHKTAELTLAQLQKQLSRLEDELASLKQQIEQSRKQRKTALQQQKQTLDTKIKQYQQQLATTKTQHKSALTALQQDLEARLRKIDSDAERDIQQTQSQIDSLTQQKRQALSELDEQRLNSLRERHVDTVMLTRLEANITQLQAELSAAEKAGEILHDYQRWLDKDWPRHSHWLDQIRDAGQKQQRLTCQLQQCLTDYQSQREVLENTLNTAKQTIDTLDKDIGTIKRLLEELAFYPKPPVAQASFDPSHTLLLLQNDYRKLTGQHKKQHRELAQLVSHFKRVFSRFPGTLPASYYASVEAEIGIDGLDSEWSSRIQNWYNKDSEDSKRWLVMQAQTFGSAIRNYQQALERFDRGIDSLSRRLATHIDSNIRFEKIESIQGRLSSKVSKLGYWEQIVQFTRNFDDWSRTGDGAVPDQEFAEMVRLVSEQLQGKGRLEMKLVNLLELEIIVSENGRSKRATHADELRQISSHGLSYLILCVFFIALVNMIRKDQPLNIIWPMDELKELHQMNIELLVDILNQNRITLLSAFPDPDPEVLSLFKNRYQVVGYRELVEMDIDDEYLSTLQPLTKEDAHV